MFDWFWEFLYGITKSILRLIDGLISCANKLCGIEDIKVDGQETDFMSYILGSESIADGFKIAAVLGFIALILFTIFRILFVITKEKPEMSPGQVCIKAFKTLLMFFFVPVVMFALVAILNAFMRAMYTATTAGRQSLGTFLFEIFSRDAVTNPGQWEAILESPTAYQDTDLVWEAIELSDFDFLLSWIAGILLLFNLGNALLTFVDRAISIAVLFIVSPFSIASAVIDDGARFKLWREQVLVKFIIGYGMILFFNVYCLIVGLVTPAGVVFFDSDFLNGLFKLIIILGGGFAMLKSVAVMGNLVASGAGSREMLDANVAGLASKTLGLMGKGAMLAGKGAFKLGKYIHDKKKKKDDKKDDKSDDDKKEDEESTSDDESSGEPMDKNPKFSDGDNGVNNTLKNEGGDKNTEANPFTSKFNPNNKFTPNESYRGPNMDTIGEASKILEEIDEEDEDEDESESDD